MERLERFLLVGTMAAMASGAQAESRHRIDIPAGRLDASVVMLGRQSGISIGVSDPHLATLRVGRVRGSLTVRQALRQLVGGTKADFISLGDNSWRIVRRRGATVPTIARTKRPAPAPGEPPPEEIIVTANKRATPLSAYPGSVAVLGLAEFPVGAEGGGTEVIAARLAGVTSTHYGPGRNKLFIRGIADSSFNGPAQATVGQYLGEARLNYNAPDPDLRLYDIASIEVLQGPQGTLHGAGSLGGVLRISPATPKLDIFEGRMSGSAGLTQHGAPSYDLSAMVNLPLVDDRIGLRIVGYGIRDGGYIDDRLRGLKDVNRTDTFGGRVALRAEPAPGWTIDLGGAFQSIEGDDSQYADKDAPDLSKESPVAQAYSNDFQVGQAVIRKQWGNFSFLSATAIVHQDLHETYDATQPNGPPTLFRQRNHISLISTENRIAKDMAGGIGWVVGTSIVRNRYRLTRAFEPVPAFAALTGLENGLDEATLFGEMTLGITSRIRLTGGGRLTHARTSGEALGALTALFARDVRMQANRTQTNLLPSLAITYLPRPDLTIFLRYQEGFRPGGIVARSNFVEHYRSDHVASAEAGLRFGHAGATAFHGALAFAYTRWRDVQADLVDGGGLPTTVNIGDGRVYTIDATIGWSPVAGLALEAAAVVAESELTNPLPSAIIVATSDLPNVARYNARVGADYRTMLGAELELSLSAWARYVGKSRLGIGPILGQAQGDYLDTALGARIGTDRYGFSLDVSNLLDTVGNRFALGSPFTMAHQSQITPLRPRTIKVGADFRF